MAAQKWDIHINIYALIFQDRPVEERKALTEKRKSEPKGIGTMRLLLTIHYTLYILHYKLYTIHYSSALLIPVCLPRLTKFELFQIPSPHKIGFTNYL